MVTPSTTAMLTHRGRFVITIEIFVASFASKSSIIYSKRKCLNDSLKRVKEKLQISFISFTYINYESKCSPNDTTCCRKSL